MSTTEYVPASASERDRHQWMAEHHAKQAQLYRRVGNEQMARQAEQAARKASERAQAS
jgi:hypothetical protein